MIDSEWKVFFEKFKIGPMCHWVTLDAHLG